jgi:hypothetical protein
MRTTIVLVHGAFAESASWDGVIEPLIVEGHRVVAAPNPLRGLAADAASVDGTTDLSIAVDSFHDVICQDVPAQQAARRDATVHPILEAAALRAIA